MSNIIGGNTFRASAAITVGPSRDCPDAGENACNIYVKAVDGDGRQAIKNRSIGVNFPAPAVTITGPAEGVQQGSFAVSVSDSGEGITCDYRVNSTAMSNWLSRPCNSDIGITISLSGQCTQQGSCTVYARSCYTATDICGEDSRLFDVRFPLPVSEITSPAQASMFASDFDVSIRDTSYSGSLSLCEYRVESAGNETLGLTSRACNLPVTITVGEGRDCRNIGNATCAVFVRSTDSANNTGASRALLYSIDWTKPVSDITLPAAKSWQRSNFSITVSDSAGVALYSCQYRVESGIATRAWTNRACNSQQLITIGAGIGNDCREGSCTVYVRAKSAVATGNEVSRSFMTDYTQAISSQGFTEADYTLTETGVRFSGDFTAQLMLLEFTSCNATAPISDCLSPPFQNCGTGKPCLCSSISKSCELKCNDASGEYYLAAKGYIGREENVIVSTARAFSCPDFHIGIITDYLNTFREYDEALSVGIGYRDYAIRNDPDADNEALQAEIEKYFDARLVARSHIAYMQTNIPLLTVALSEEMINKSMEELARINEILHGEGYVPSRARLTGIEVRDTPLDMNASISAIATSGRSRYGTVDCQIKKSDGTVINSGTGCRQISGDTRLPLSVYANKAGLWNVTRCALNVSLNSNCRPAMNANNITGGTFDVYIPANATVAASLPETNIANGTIIEAVVNVTNPDVNAIYSRAVCTFTKPDGNSTASESLCIQVPGLSTTPISVRVHASQPGTWVVSSCEVRRSYYDTCKASSLIANRTGVGAANVAVVEPLAIASSGVADTSISRGESIDVNLAVRNNGSITYSPYIECAFTSTAGSTERSPTQAIPAGQSRNFTISKRADAAGTWVAERCSLFAEGRKFDEEIIGSVIAVSQPPECMGNAGCAGTSSCTAWLTVPGIHIPVR